MAFAEKTFIDYDNYYYVFFLFLPLNPLLNPFVHSSFNLKKKIRLKENIRRRIETNKMNKKYLSECMILYLTYKTFTN